MQTKDKDKLLKYTMVLYHTVLKLSFLLLFILTVSTCNNMFSTIYIEFHFNLILKRSVSKSYIQLSDKS